MKMSDFEKAKSLGVSSVTATGFMPFAEQDGHIVVDFEEASRLAMDASLATAPGVGVPASVTTFLDPGVVEILFSARNATEVFREVRKGTWEDRHFIFPVEEQVGGVTPYSDFAENSSSDVNYEYPERQNFLFQTVIKHGILEQGIASKAKLDIVSAKQRAAATVMANAHNRFYLYGVQGKRIYGMLNDPNLPASETPISVNGKSTWEDKVANAPETSANAIYNDVQKLYASLAKKNGGNVRQDGELVLAISNSRASYLSIPNSFGLTALAMLKANFPKLKIVEIPELSTSAGEMLYLTVPTLFGQPTAFNAYSEKYRMLATVQRLSSYEQKVVGGTWGSVICRPSLIATMMGI